MAVELQTAAVANDKRNERPKSGRHLIYTTMLAMGLAVSGSLTTGNNIAAAPVATAHVEITLEEFDPATTSMADFAD